METLTDLDHKAFFDAIRSGVPLDCGDYMARSSLVAVMGQLASTAERN